LHQHFLTQAAARQMVAAAGIQPDDAVMEPGAGGGALVEALLERGARVLAIEIDQKLATALRERFAVALASGRLQVLQGDFLRCPWPMPPGWRVLGNPPFQCTAALLERLLLDEPAGGPPQRIDLVLQQQAVAKCIGAAHGGHTRSSVLCQLFGATRQGRHMEREATTPPSHVPMATLHLARHADAPTPRELQAIARLLDSAFAGPHRLDAALRDVISPERLAAAVAAAGLDPAAHPRQVPAPAWRLLARHAAASWRGRPGRG
jgi:16S rRNA A1518/A1519 N6-dimethyltransferase RsmA/KsgA/DIM1 with predicted DNA glycosylase/AP lyase activity